MLFGRRDDSDAALVRAVRQGKTGQFGALVQRYRNLVYASVLARVHDVDDADDVSQEALVTAFRRLDQLDDPAKFGPWLRRIAENGALSLLRQNEARDRNRPDVALQAATPDQELEGQERERLMWDAIDRLPPDQREVVLLFYINDHSIKDIASFLHVTKGAVRGRLQRGRQQLRDDFEQELRETVGKQRRGKEFSDKVMSALPLLVWRMQPARQWGAPVGWGLRWGVTALMGLAALAVVEERWEHRQEESARTAAGMHVRVASLEERVRLADVLRGGGAGGDGGGSYSLYGSPGITAAGARAQQAALRQGHGGKLVWEFDGREGLQGWRVFPSSGFAPPHPGGLAARVEDGVLRVDLQPLLDEGLLPTLQLVSPELGYDARLFDRIDVRVRVVHPEPIRGRLLIRWTNPLNRVFPGDEPALWERSLARSWRQGSRHELPRHRFSQATDEQFVDFTPAWQVFSVEALGRRAESCWAGELVDVRVQILLGNWNQDPERGPFPRALEIDRIVLRGRADPVALPLPASVPQEAPGQWLGPGRLHALAQKGLCWPILGDLDGDQDPDLLIGWRERRWSTNDVEPSGWVTVLNDGHGGFAQESVQVLEEKVLIVDDIESSVGLSRLRGCDLDLDGRLDLVVCRGTTAEIWLNQGRGRFRQTQQWDSVFLNGVGDLNGDGAPDIVVAPYHRPTLADPDPPLTTHLLVYVNDGAGGYGDGVAWLPEGASVRGSFYLDDLDADGRPELVQWPSRDQPGGCVRVFAASLHGSPEIARFLLERLPEEGRYYVSTVPLWLGALHGDRRWSLATPLGALMDHGRSHLGAEVRMSYDAGAPRLLLPLDVHMDLGSSFPRSPFIVPQVWDLDCNGVRDIVLLDRNYRRGANLRVMRGRAGEPPELEGAYPLPGGATGWVAGDLDGDGTTDVAVVVDGSEGRGVFVLRNRRGDVSLVEAR